MQTLHQALTNTLIKHRLSFAPVVPFNLNGENIWHINLTASNPALHQINLADTEAFSRYIFGEMEQQKAVAAIGGYNEDRFLYHRSRHFDGTTEARTIHLGIDIWASAGTPVSAPLAGTVHSFANNNNFGDYGYTIILRHELDSCQFFTLYGHLSAASCEGLYEGKAIAKGQTFAWFGEPQENGHWPPHLHFQLITDMLGKSGDFPGVCAPSERDYYLSICLNPAILLGV
ncbi:peptidoglycan DD-metalloendopeptidase family protein [Rhodoflexus caldus]|uniref:peptidoglycan DD-metalloendopeptidase family protein n=1 Tax=Rhodoflexus caldus TaxID=2891236 RepID=UPI002029FF32|nr:peptidoglycan DD-metalloendopeptidase family protein [Rhodoflexus caldus]